MDTANDRVSVHSVGDGNTEGSIFIAILIKGVHY